MLSDEIIRSARRAMLNRARSIRQAEFADAIECEFTAAQIRSGAAGEGVRPWLEETLGDQVTRPALYSISVGKAETAEAIVNAFGELPSESARGYRLPRRNPAVQGHTILYVGGSEDIRRRLKEHIGVASATTYAMNLQRWCPQFDDFVTVKVQSFSPAASRECRQDIEDALWVSLQPIFGKRGSK
jgi:hypothetical protein